MQGKKHLTEKLFLSFQLSHRVPADNFYRRLKEQLDLQFVYKSTKKYYGAEGQQSIDPAVFFKLILIGYLENLNSDRKIIDHSKMRLDILYFLGYDLDEELPWHGTLSRTRQLYGQEVFKELFGKVLGTLINFMGVRRIWSRGLQAANKFMLGAAIACNLKKWLNFKAPKTKTATMALQTQPKLFIFTFSGYGNFCIITTAAAK